jgi:hypothetical protein
VNDFDDTLKQLLNERVDAQLGSRRSAPAFDPDAVRPSRGLSTGKPAGAGSRGVRSWVAPLLAAACVVAVAGGTVGASQLLSHRRSTPPATSAPVPQPTASDSSPSAISSAPTSPSAQRSGKSGSSSSSGGMVSAPGFTTVNLGGATIAIPAGWQARDYAQYLPSGSSSIAAKKWCLTPSSQQVSTTPGACPVEFSEIAAKAAGNAIDVDTEGGFSSNPEYCAPGDQNVANVHSTDTTFGGRAADSRRWHLGCRSGKSFDIEQYVVATGPGFILFYEHADDAMHATMAQIAARSTLPAATDAVRYYDHGYVRAIRQVTGGYQVSVDRVVPEGSSIVNNNPATYDYLIPAALYVDSKLPLTIGELITVNTDGTQVTMFYAG